MYQPWKNENGTSLIELVTVAVLIGLLSAMAVPRWLEYLPQLRTRSAARDAVSTLREARSRAISQKVPYGVYFDTDRGACVMFCDTDSPGANTYVVDDSTIMTRSIAHDVRMSYSTFTNNVVFFQPSGEASMTGALTLTSENYRTTLVIDVLAGTGKVKLTEQADQYETL